MGRTTSAYPYTKGGSDGLPPDLVMHSSVHLDVAYILYRRKLNAIGSIFGIAIPCFQIWVMRLGLADIPLTSSS
jgi:hypothetical protein